jgi:hypothetical protein
MYRDEVDRIFKGRLYTSSPGIESTEFIESGKLGRPLNSGAGSILLAYYFGASRIILIGYDCHKRGGTHHHGNHPKGLGNAGSMPKWHRQFRELAQRVSAQIINCSPDTALNAFPLGELETCLANRNHAGSK